MENENLNKNVQSRKPSLVIMQVVDDEGKPVENFKAKNIRVLNIIKKLEPEMFEELQQTPGAFIIKI